ncbi:MAG: alpha/beta fold hydrolase [bacterium]
MTHRFVLVSFVIGLAALQSCTRLPSGRSMIAYSELLAVPVAPPDQRIAYGSETLQFGELRLPPGSDPAPLIVLMHGGCWRSQYDLKHVGAAAEALAKEGFVVWSIEYRRIGDLNGGWPGTFDDVAHAVDYVTRLAAQYPRIDTTRVVLMGHSAGGQLALWAASRKQNEQSGLFRSSIAPLKVAGVVSLAGITDLVEFGAGTGGCNTSVAPLLGGTPQQVPQRYKAVSPVERVPLGVFVRLVHGDADPIVPLAQSRAFLKRARGDGDRAELDVIAGGGHFDLLAPQSTAWPTVVRAAKWAAGPGAKKMPGHSGL